MEIIDLSKKQEFRAIDLMKAICALLVVSIHIGFFGTNTDSGIGIQINFLMTQWAARIAVPFFFISSGFFLFRKESCTDFHFSIIWKYVIHILELYGIWTVIYLPLQLLNWKRSGEGFGEWLLYYLQQCIFKGSYVHLWYLPSLIVGVLLVAFCIQNKMSLKVMMMIVSALYLIGLLGTSWNGLMIPVEVHFPLIAEMLQRLMSVILTTRNGVFEGFFFVAFGAVCAHRTIPLTHRKAGIGFTLCYAAMLAEILFVTYFGRPAAYSTTLFMAPTACFLFLFASSAEIRQDSGIYKKLRLFSTVTFFTHLWVQVVLWKLAAMISFDISTGPLDYWSVVLVCILETFLMIRLRKYRMFRWLNTLF